MVRTYPNISYRKLAVFINTEKVGHCKFWRFVVGKGSNILGYEALRIGNWRHFREISTSASSVTRLKTWFVNDKGSRTYKRTKTIKRLQLPVALRTTRFDIHCPTWCSHCIICFVRDLEQTAAFNLCICNRLDFRRFRKITKSDN